MSLCEVGVAQAKSFIDYIKPAPIVCSPLSSATWGVAGVLPRDTCQGIESAKGAGVPPADYYWDGQIIRATDGKYHMFMSTWPGSSPNGFGDWTSSNAFHAISSMGVEGPYMRQDFVYSSHRGHNVSAAELLDGTYVVVVSEIVPFTIYKSTSLDGPWTACPGGELIQQNGVTTNSPTPCNPGGPCKDSHWDSNVSLVARPDGKFEIVQRHGFIAIADTLCGPYKMQKPTWDYPSANVPDVDSIYPKRTSNPLVSNPTYGWEEDPHIWYSAGTYHVIYSGSGDRVGWHLYSPDGIHHWKDGGLAYSPRVYQQMFCYEGSTTCTQWYKAERPGVVLENGHPTHITLAVADVDKDYAIPTGSNHGSKVVVLPFDGVAFDQDYGSGAGGAGGSAGGSGGSTSGAGGSGAGGTAGGSGAPSSTGGAGGSGGAGSGVTSGSSGTVGSGGNTGNGGTSDTGSSVGHPVAGSGGSSASGGVSGSSGASSVAGGSNGSDGSSSGCGCALGSARRENPLTASLLLAAWGLLLVRRRTSIVVALGVASAAGCSEEPSTSADHRGTGGSSGSGEVIGGGAPGEGGGVTATAGTTANGLGSGGATAVAGSTGVERAGSASTGAGGSPGGQGGTMSPAGGGSSATGGMAGMGGVSAGGGSAGTGTCDSTFKNPVIWEDLADDEVIRVGDTYYYTASTMHYSPGAPILRSTDLVHWEYVSHAVPVLDYGPTYDLNGGRAYINGIWASSLRYRKSNQTFYWIGCMHNTGGGYVYTAPAVEGPWTKHKSGGCYYDVGLLIDDDDTMYVAYGNTTISVAQLSADGFSQVKSQQVFTSPSNIGALEGSHFYKINGSYYILSTQYANGEYALRSTTGPFGPYTLQPFSVKIPTPVPGAGFPHQGSIVDTQNGDWYYMAFLDAYPGGRIPVLAPITWTNGWPSVNLVDNGWGASYPFPKLPCGASVKARTGVDTFAGPSLGPEWEWNHNPDNTKWSAGGGLTLQAATVTSDLYAARNTLTHRILGPTSAATIVLDYSAMKDGDVAGLALLRQSSAWIGVKRAAGVTNVAMVNDLTMDGNWNTTSTGTEAASASVSGGKIWLRIASDIHPGANRQARFSYSTDGSQFTSLGQAFNMDDSWQFFMGYRYAIFNYATQTVGGSVKVSSFEISTP